MNIKDKARKRALLLHCAGPKVQDIFDTLEDTGEDFKTAGEKLLEYFEPKRHHLFSIYQFRQLAQEEEESYDDYTTRLKQAAAPCEFPEGWREVEIQMQLIEKGKSKRVRRRLLSKPHSLQEALDYARAQELSDKQAKRIEMEQQSRRNKYRGRIEESLFRKAKEPDWYQQRVLLLWRRISTRGRKGEMSGMGKEMHHMREAESFCQML